MPAFDAHMMSKRRSRCVPSKWLLCLPFILQSCASDLEFRHLTHLETRHVQEAAGTEVVVRFEIVDEDGDSIQGLLPEHFTAFEDGVPASSESLSIPREGTARVPVAFLLDQSQSVFEPSAQERMGAAARSLLAKLREFEAFEPKVYAFARELQEITGPGELHTASTRLAADERWTALYHSIYTLLREDPHTVFVIFSDGADNYSENLGKWRLSELEKQLWKHGTAIYAVASQTSDAEFDRRGVPAREALRRLAVHGSTHELEDAGSLQELEQALLNHLRSVYTYTFRSPHLSGTHTLELEVDAPAGSGRSAKVTFQGLAGPDFRPPYRPGAPIH